MFPFNIFSHTHFHSSHIFCYPQFLLNNPKLGKAQSQLVLRNGEKNSILCQKIIYLGRKFCRFLLQPSLIKRFFQHKVTYCLKNSSIPYMQIIDILENMLLEKQELKRKKMPQNYMKIAKRRKLY